VSKKSFTAYLLMLFGAFSCRDKKTPPWPLGVKYEVFVRSFADGNGDGIGDFVGLTRKLDYIQALGVNGIWLMPIMKSKSYHKYDVMDYKSIDPEYGTIEEFKVFLREAHKRNIKVVIDLIVNHTAFDHPWFQSAINEKNSSYRNYYVWAQKDSITEVIAKKETALDSDNINQWHPVKGDSLGEHYYGYFWDGMPDLNFDNPKVKQEFVEIGHYWLKELGVDGFRLDAAKHIFTRDRADDNHAFWVWFRAEMQKIKPDVYLVGEVWSPAEEVAPYLKGLPSLFNFDMGYSIIEAVQAEQDAKNIIKKYKSINDYYGRYSKEFLDATFLRNHDQNRVMSELAGDMDKAKIAASILLTLPGTPYIYYGEEIGMKGMKPDEYIREPLLWATTPDKDKLETEWLQPKYSTSLNVTPIALQLGNPRSLLNFYKGLINYRNGQEALTKGELLESDIENESLVSFIRKSGKDELLVVHNLTNTSVEITLFGSLKNFNSVDYSTSRKRIKLKKGLLTIPSYTSLIIKRAIRK
jgi:alpha-amylase